MGQFQFTADSSALFTGSFREWTLREHQAIVSAGFVDTLASGSITVGMTQSTPAGGNAVSGFDQLRPPNVTNQSVGYVIYRFNDPLQTAFGGCPIFFKVEYGSNAGPANW